MRFSSDCATVAFVKDGVLSQSDTREGAPARDLVRLPAVPTTGGKPVSSGLKMPDLRQLSIHPDGNRIAFTSVRWNYEAWAIDNLLPKR